MEQYPIYIIAALGSWVVAQAFKYLYESYRRRSFKNAKHIYLTGGMPSAHSATVVALATIIGLKNSFDSAIFALALVFAVVVVYDSVMVRRSSGEQGEALVGLIKEQKSKVKLPFVAKGHSIKQALAGVLLGVIVAYVAFCITK